MATSNKGLRSAALAGVLAGAVFAVMEVAGAAVMGNPPLMPFRMFASVVFGRSALMELSGLVSFFGGGLIHLALSALYGVAFGLLFAHRRDEQLAPGWGARALGGTLFGLGLWLINFQLIARLLYPWFLEAPQLLQAMMHALFFGLPLGLFVTAFEHRWYRTEVPPRPG